MATAFCVYIFLTLSVTILPLPLFYPIIGPLGLYFNLVPFVDLFEGSPYALKEIVLNIIMMVPFGFFVSFFSKRKRLVKALLLAFLFSLTIETIQLIYGLFWTNLRSFDITDIITNTSGAALGALGFKILDLVLAWTKKTHTTLWMHENRTAIWTLYDNGANTASQTGICYSGSQSIMSLPHSLQT